MTQAPQPFNTVFTTPDNSASIFGAPQRSGQGAGQRTGKRSNTLGLIGFLLSTLGLLTCCLPYVSLVSVVGLILSFIALFKAPRGFAIAGTLVGLLASIIAIVWVIAISLVGAAAQGVGGLRQFVGAAIVAGAIEEFEKNKGTLPPDLGALPVPTEWRNDKWGEPFHYEVSKDGLTYSLRSKGPDKVAGTPDDIDFTQIFEGKHQGFVLPGVPGVPPQNVPLPPSTDKGPDTGPV